MQQPPEPAEVLAYADVAYVRWVDDPISEGIVYDMPGAPPSGYKWLGDALCEIALERSTCPYCQGALRAHNLNRRLRGTFRQRLWTASHLGISSDEARGVICTHCGWWFVERARDDSGPVGAVAVEYTFAIGLLQRTTVGEYGGPIEGLRTYLAAHPDCLTSAEPVKVEQLVTSALRDIFDRAEVRHVGRSGDGGVDVVIARGGVAKPIVVQVKRRASTDAREGVEAIRELHGVMFRDKLSRGMVVSTASRFTAGALAESRRVRHRLVRYRMDLLNRRDVAELLALPTTTSAAPWDVYGVDWPAKKYGPVWEAEERGPWADPDFTAHLSR